MSSNPPRTVRLAGRYRFHRLFFQGVIIIIVIGVDLFAPFSPEMCRCRLIVGSLDNCKHKQGKENIETLSRVAETNVLLAPDDYYHKEQ